MPIAWNSPLLVPLVCMVSRSAEQNEGIMFTSSHCACYLYAGVDIKGVRTGSQFTLLTFEVMLSYSEHSNGRS